MSMPEPDTHELLGLARAGDQDALARLFEASRERLLRTVRLRIDPRLRGRIDDLDVLQDAWGDVSRHFPEFDSYPDMPLFLWFRMMTVQKLAQLHRFHLGVGKRDAGREISLYRGSSPPASSVSLAAQLLGRLTTASEAAVRAENKILLQEALASMDALDREVLALRHFEYLSNSETARILDITENAASNRYVRAIKRLKEILATIPGMRETYLP